jgi:CRP/FNR family transcriptional regulator, cyclic AMP receptor protein
MKVELPQVFMRKGRTFSVEAEQPIASGGRSSKEVYIVVSGQVLLHSSSVRGREFVIDVLKPGDLFGMAALLGAGHRVDAISLTRCTITAVDVATIERAMLAQPDFALSIVRFTLQHVMRRTAQAEDFALLSFGGRLAKLLLSVAADEGARIAKGSKFKCEYSQTLMADGRGVARDGKPAVAKMGRERTAVAFRQDHLPARSCRASADRRWLLRSGVGVTRRRTNRRPRPAAVSAPARSGIATDRACRCLP